MGAGRFYAIDRQENVGRNDRASGKDEAKPLGEELEPAVILSEDL
jgi:hypothetical protein